MLDGFMIEYNGIISTESDGGFAKTCTSSERREDGSICNITIFESNDGALEVTNKIITYPGLNLVEKWVDVKNVSQSEIKVTRVDSMHGSLPEGKYRLKYFTSSHGREFCPQDVELEGTKILEVTTGRSSQGIHPWLYVEGADGGVLALSIAWSGSWIARFEPMLGNCYRISGGLNNWNFFKLLKPGSTMEGVHIIYVYLPQGKLDDVSVEFGKWGRKYWYPKSTLSLSMPVEWNHWYPYTDACINEDVFKANVDKCAELGMDVCTLDAGWFGPSDEASEWYFIRGDWHKINSRRFPSGIKALADYTHSKGLKFGIWCEIEAMGAKADLNELHPEFAAERDGRNLGYICMGNPEAVEWAFGVLENLIAGYGADWIKLDFNLSPGAGCNRTDHGHGEGDGLYEHYTGYYRLLDRVREKYPGVILENCSGGGLRIDLGILRHTHFSFLSDPDYPQHAHQVFWGATTMLHPSACLHWAWSQTTRRQREDFDNDPIRNDMPVYKFDYIMRNALLKNPGFSYKLVEFPRWCQNRLAYHVGFYKSVMKSYVRDADLYRLTGQALRTDDGDSWNGYLYVMEDKGSAILFVFRLPGGEKERSIRLKGLDPDAAYVLKFQDSGISYRKTGIELMNEGIVFDGLEEESSEVLLLVRN